MHEQQQKHTFQPGQISENPGKLMENKKKVHDESSSIQVLGCQNLPGTPGVVGVMNIHMGLKDPKPRLYNCKACER